MFALKMLRFLIATMCAIVQGVVSCWCALYCYKLTVRLQTKSNACFVFAVRNIRIGFLQLVNFETILQWHSRLLFADDTMLCFRAGVHNLFAVVGCITLSFMNYGREWAQDIFIFLLVCSPSVLIIPYTEPSLLPHVCFAVFLQSILIQYAKSF